MVLLSIGSWLLSHFFGRIYPAYRSYKAIESRNVNELYTCLIYWVVYALLATFETVADIFIFWIPFYYELKLIAILWTALPQTKGAIYLYDYYIQPQMRLYYEPRIERILYRFEAIAKQKLIEHGRRVIAWAQKRLLHFLFWGKFMMVDPANPVDSHKPGVASSRRSYAIPPSRFKELSDTDSDDLMAEAYDEEPDSYSIIESTKYSSSLQRRPVINETKVISRGVSSRTTNNVAVGRIGYARPYQPQRQISSRCTSASYHAQQSQQIITCPASPSPTYEEPAYGSVPFEPNLQYTARQDEEVFRLRGERERLNRLINELEKQEERLGRYTATSTDRYPTLSQQHLPSSSISEEDPILTSISARTRSRKSNAKNGNVGGIRNTMPSRVDESGSSNNSNGKASKISRPGPFG